MFLGSVFTRLLASNRLCPLLPSGIPQKRLLRLPSDRSRDCIANIFLYRHCMTTSNKASWIVCLFQLVTAQLVSPALFRPRVQTETLVFHSILIKFILIFKTCTCYVSLTIVMKSLLNYMFNFRIKCALHCLIIMKSLLNYMFNFRIKCARHCLII